MKLMKFVKLNTPLGYMMAIANEEKLFLLEFEDRPKLEREIKNLKLRHQSELTPGVTPAIRMIEDELTAYFAGKLKEFKTPLHMSGTEFQKKVWNELVKIPFGKTRSYLEIARVLENPLGYRAAAQANGANQLAIIVPCHRVINSNGDLGGYAGGIARKKWLLTHEKNHERREMT